MKVILFLFLFIASIDDLFAQNEPYGMIMNRIYLDLQNDINDKVLTDRVNKTLLNFKSDGSWGDINYTDVQYDPLRRIKEMTMAFIRPSNQLYNDPKIYASITKSLQNWLDRKPVNKNWWYNDIYYPQVIGQTLILMQSAKRPLSADLKNALIMRMKRKLKAGDGANTSDVALHYLYRACLTENQITLDSAANFLFEPIAIMDDKGGVQVDGSYYQHGKQQSIASYGRVFAENSVNAAYYLHNTSYALSQEKMKVLVGFIKNTFSRTMRNGFYDFNVRGRGLSRKDSLKGDFSRMMMKMKLIDHEDVNSGSEPFHRHYWKSGYTLHIRPTYTFSVQTASKRTLRTERGNNENILGKFLADGATNIQRNGPEYLNIMPIWEWDKIPGTTSRDYLDDGGSTIEKEWGIPGTTGFVGGVSDGLYGLSTYSLNYDSVQAKKSWFFFDQEIVCLGAGIKSKANEHITTSLNQSWSKGTLTSSFKGERVEKSASSNEIWLIQDSIGYVLPKGGNLKISNDVQKGNWYRINHFESKQELQERVFKLWIDHGAKPENGSYEYVVLPGIGKNGISKYNRNTIKILENTESLQAVEHTGLNMLMAVFYKPGMLKNNDMTIKVDKACAIYIKQLGSEKPTLYVSDPGQQHVDIQIELMFSGEKKITCTMPSGAYAGSTASFIIK